MPRTIDADALRPERLPGAVVTEFELLAIGEAILLSSGHPPKEALAALQREAAGTFDWNVLQNGPDRFRVEIRRRPPSNERTVRDVLTADHDRLDRVATEVAELMEGPAREDAGVRLDELICGLERHFTQEENVLFTAIERVSAEAPQHLDVLRREHVVIRGLMKGLREAFAQQRAGDVATAAATLRLELRRHARKELWILYPLLDEISGSKRPELLQALEEV